MIFSVLSMSLLFPLYTVRSLVPYFVILQFVAGAIGVALGPTTRAFVSDESPKKSVGLFASLWWAVFILGRTIGPLLGAFIAQVWSFEYSFYASTILSLVTALLILLVFRNERAARTRNSLGVIGGLRSIARVRSLSFLFISAMFAFMGVSLMRSFLPLYASEQVQMSTLDVGILIGATSAAQLVALPMLGWLSDRFGRKRTVLFGFGLAAFTFLLFFLVGSQLQLLVVSLAVSIGLSASSLLLLALIPDVASKKLYGSVVGVYGSFEDVGLILGPVMFGLIWSAYTPIMIFAAGSITQIVGACFLWPLRQKQSRRG
jgi:DHA1 family multidrug resistance protein-like MFS transporter